MPATAYDEVGRLHLKEERTHQHRRFHALARDHQQGEQKHTGNRLGAHLQGGLFKMFFDLPLHLARVPPHVDNERRH
jgi:hypothetical protein